MTEKSGYKEKIKAQIGQLEEQFNKLIKTAEAAKEQIKTEYQKQVKSLQGKQEAAGRKFREIKKSSSGVFDEVKAAADKSLEDVKKSLNNFIAGLKETMEKRDVYIKKIEEQLSKLNIQIDKLTAMADKAKDDVKAEYYKQINVLQEKQKIINDKLQEIKKSSVAAWADIKAGMDRSAQEFKKALDQAISKFK